MSPAEKPVPRIEFSHVTDEAIRPKECITCGSNEVIRRGYQFHDTAGRGPPLVRRILRHEKITWECKKCGTQFMVLNTSAPFDTEYTDDVKQYALKRVLDKGDAANRVAADLADLHNVEVTPQAIGEWVRKEQAKSETRQRLGAQGGEKDSGNSKSTTRPGAPVLSLDGTFKAVRTKKKARRTSQQPPSPRK